MQYLTISKGFFWILIAIFSVIQPKLSGQSIEQTFAHADSLMLVKDYETAIPLLRRVIFFNPELFPEAYSMLGDCYKQKGNKDKSLYYYNLALKVTSGDSLKAEAQFDIIALHLKNNEPNFALSKLFSLKAKENNYLSRKKNFYFSLAYYQLKNFDKSSEYFMLALRPESAPARAAIDSLYQAALKNNRFNPNLPMLLSTVPGMGQLYLGEYGAAANSLLLTSAMAGVYILAIKELTLLDAILSIFPWFQRYYSGGILKTKSLAVKKKETRYLEIYNALIKLYFVEIDGHSSHSGCPASHGDK